MGSGKINILRSADWLIILLYVILVGCGLFLIYSAQYNGAEGLPARFISQIVWFGLSVCVAIFILLVDSKFWYEYSYHGYFFMLALLILVGLVARPINGAKSWIALGGFSIQPVEFMKIISSLALARYMSGYSFDMRDTKDFFTMAGMILAPMFIVIVLQNDTGSSLVFCSYLLMLYREGLSKIFYIIILSLIGIFVSYFILEPYVNIALIITVSVIAFALKTGDIINHIRYLAIFYLIFLLLYIFVRDSVSWLTPEYLLLIAFGLTTPFIVLYFKKETTIIHYVIYIIASICYYFSVKFVFSSILQLHQRKRILSLLGIEADIYGWGYNVNQSKIAIGSGGLFGKGFLNGTQTKYNFVPEQSTDFIFCTVGEEFGFIGSSFVIILFAILIIRLIYLADKINDAYSRIYCYCVASVFLFHLVINVGMTIGVMPVIGIPLPFFSYGGSSLLAFTIMLALAIKLNMDNIEKI